MNEDLSKITIQDLPLSERTPTVCMLLSFIETLQQQLEKQAAQLEVLTHELRKQRKLKEKPKLRASKLPKDPDDPPPGSSGGKDASDQRPGSKKRKKNNFLKITHEEIIKAESVPEGSIHKGYQDFIIQELEIKPLVIKYRLERWLLPDGGGYTTAKLPVAIKGHHFGPTLRAYILHQYHHQCVTQPLLYNQLKEWNINISKGQLNRLLIEDKEAFHAEKASILSTGLSISKHIQVDDTGSRHKGTNGYCTHIGNELFAWFESTSSKSRINFLKLLQQSVQTYCITEDSIHYMKRYKVAACYRESLKSYCNQFFTEAQWDQLLSTLNIERQHLKRLVTEAALIGSLFKNGLSKDLIVLSDDAGQFNVFQHALCWIHAERGIKSIIPLNDMQAKAVTWARGEIWDIYHKLLDYKKNPQDTLKLDIEKHFDTFCKSKTEDHIVNLALKRFALNKAELLRVLKHPHIPLHNNLSEGDIREYVKRRKVSGSTRSDEGRRCRDSFASLKKTALKLGVGFWDYLIDRIRRDNQIPQLSSLMENMAKS